MDHETEDTFMATPFGFALVIVIMLTMVMLILMDKPQTKTQPVSEKHTYFSDNRWMFKPDIEPDIEPDILPSAEEIRARNEINVKTRFDALQLGLYERGFSGKGESFTSLSAPEGASPPSEAPVLPIVFNAAAAPNQRADKAYPPLNAVVGPLVLPALSPNCACAAPPITPEPLPTDGRNVPIPSALILFLGAIAITIAGGTRRAR